MAMAADSLRSPDAAREIARRHRRARWRRMPLVSMAILALVVIVAIVGPLLGSIDPFSGTLSTALKPPIWMDGGTWANPLGTDQLGRDVLSRLVVGARMTLLVAICGVVGSALVGTAIGLVAGYFGGWIDAVLMRITDATLAIPLLVLGLALATTLGPGIVNVVVVVTAVSWAFFARLVRGEVLHVRRLEFVLAAQIAGIPRRRILARHVLPNVLAPILVMSSLQIGNTIILAASLSFLGLGVPEPQPEWGLMLANSRDYLSMMPHLVVIPGVALGLLVLSANLVGDWLRDRFDPHLEHVA
jgi:peptide/nickel transport system permease protein